MNDVRLVEFKPGLAARAAMSIVKPLEDAGEPPEAILAVAGVLLDSYCKYADVTISEAMDLMLNMLDVIKRGPPPDNEAS